LSRRIILASAFTGPERITSHLQGEGIWIYAGKNIKRFHVFEKTFRQAINHASPAHFREFTISNRHAFVQWTEKVHLQYGHDLTHWLSDTFSSNPYMSNLFFYCMNLAWFRTILNEHPRKDIVFVAESHALLLIADVIASKYNDSEIYKYGFNKEKIRFFYGIGRSILGGYVGLLFLFIRYVFAYVYRIHKNKNELQKVSVIVDSYIFENSFDRKGKFVNRYFSELHEFLCKTGIPVGIFSVFYNVSLKKLKYIFKSIYQGNARFILLEDFLKPIDYFSALFYPLKRLWSFERVQDFKGINIQSLVDEENWANINSSNFILSLLVNKLPKRIRESGMNPSVYINWSENQTIHRAIISGFHRNFVKMEVIGGKPFFPPLNHLNLFNTNNERIFGYAPDRIVTCGVKLKSIFSIYDNDGNYDVGASFRYGYLRNIIDKNHVRPGDNSKYRIILILLPYSITISRYILASSTKAIRNAIDNGWNIKIKTHPTLTKSDIVMLFKEYDIPHECIEVTCEDMGLLLPKSSAVLTTASSAAVEAICLGIPVVSVGMPIGLDFNMLDYLPSSMWKLAFTDDDIDLGLNKWALRHPLSFEERREIGRKVLMDFFEENTNESMQVYVESLKN
jgi:hypothetical protein